MEADDRAEVETPAGAAVKAIRQDLGTRMPETYLGPEGDYLRLTRREPPIVDASISCHGSPESPYSVQVCLGGDPLDIAFDDECDLPTLVALCAYFFLQTEGG